MPRLSFPQWLAVVVFLLFYGFAVFALTRDYYLRHPVQTTAAAGQSAAATHGDAASEPITETDPLLLYKRADAYFAQQRFDEAARVYRRVLELNPNDSEAHIDLGLALQYLGDGKGALEHLRAAVAKNPDLQRAWLSLGFVSLQAQDQKGALEALERARTLGPETDAGKEAARLLEAARKP